MVTTLLTSQKKKKSESAFNGHVKESTQRADSLANDKSQIHSLK